MFRIGRREWGCFDATRKESGWIGQWTDRTIESVSQASPISKQNKDGRRGSYKVRFKGRVVRYTKLLAPCESLLNECSCGSGESSDRATVGWERWKLNTRELYCIQMDAL